MEKQKISRKEAQNVCFGDICMILSELCGGNYKTYMTQYINVGYQGVLGAIIVEIRRRKAAGDDLRQENNALKEKIIEYSQLKLF